MKKFIAALLALLVLATAALGHPGRPTPKGTSLPRPVFTGPGGNK